MTGHLGGGSHCWRWLRCALQTALAVASISVAVAAESPPISILPPPPAEPSLVEPASAVALIDRLPEAIDPLPAPTELVPTPADGDPQPSPTDTGPLNSDAVPPPLVWYQPGYWFGPTPWDVGIELGINGAQGTREAISFRGGGRIERKSDWSEFRAEGFYNRNKAGGVETQNNAQFDARNDWLLPDSPWTVFGLTTLLYDEFQAFDLRVTLHGGVGHQFCDGERASLRGRFGAGTSREVGGPDNTWVPEAVFGGEFKYKISDSQKFHINTEYFPKWEDYREYRVVTDAGWTIDLDEPGNTSLKLSVNDQYDSTPNGANPNLLNYSVLLLWSL